MSTLTIPDLRPSFLRQIPKPAGRPAPLPAAGHAEELRAAREELWSLLHDLPDPVRAHVLASAAKPGRRRRRGFLSHERLDAAYRKLEEHARWDSDTELGETLSRARRLRERILHAREQLVLANLHLVPQAIRRFRMGAIPFADLVQEGRVGLLEAVDRFDPSRGFRFSTYAVWWIRRAVFEAFSQRSRLIRLPESVREGLRRMRWAEKDLEDRLGRRPDSLELAARMRVPTTKVRKLVGISPDPTPIEDLRDGDDGLGERTLDPDPLERLVSSDLARQAREALQLLDPRERAIVRLRFGFDGGKERTLAEIGSVIGLSRERVRQLESEALSKIREWAAERGLRSA